MQNYNLLLTQKFIFSGKRQKGGSFYATGHLCANNQFLILKDSHINFSNFYFHNCRFDFQ